jgi:hypothetical protein
MASKKKSVASTYSTKRAKEAMALSRRAKAEVEMLLKRDRAGSLTRGKLETGLKEVDGRLKRMLWLIRHFL